MYQDNLLHYQEETMKLNLKAKNNNQKRVLDYLEANASNVLVEKINTGEKTMAQCW